MAKMIKISMLARSLRGAFMQAFASDTDEKLRELATAARLLIPSMTCEPLADISAQLICCGIFAARCHARSGISITRKSLAAHLTTSQPYLRALFDSAADPGLDESMAGVIDALIEAVNGIDLDDFRRHGHQSDALNYFYETFLSAYDPGTRGRRGVFYTPEPLASYIVRSVDHLLKTDFGVTGWLAGILSTGDVQILDPAMGTGTFLRCILDQAYTGFEGDSDQWTAHIERQLLPYLTGWELLPVPYLLAHMALERYLPLQAGREGRAMTGNREGRAMASIAPTLSAGVPGEPGGGLRLHLGNVLDGELRGMLSNARIMVVIGNPPYAGHSANEEGWIADLLRGYDSTAGERTVSYFTVGGQPLNERNSKWLNDDYVKFVRCAQWLIERVGSGILAFITNHSYLDSPTFRGMRRSLMHCFDDIYVLDLHGNSKRNTRGPDGTRDENVFAIQQGIAVGLFVKRGRAGAQLCGENIPGSAKVHYAELRGSRAMKYRWLSEHDCATTAWTDARPELSLNLFVPRDCALQEEYERGWPITEILPVYSLGVLTKRDALTIGFSEQEIIHSIAAFADPEISDAECCALFNVPVRDKDTWDIERARAAIRGDVSMNYVRPILYRPFDMRSIYYHEAVVARRNTRVMHHLGQPNRALVLGRQGWATGAESWDVLFAAATLADQNIFRRGGGTVFPLYLYPDARANFLPAFIDAVGAVLQIAYVSYGHGDLRVTFGPEDVFDYIYAALHATDYRTRYAGFLKNDFPRVPLPASADLFRALCPLGARLAALHMMEEFEGRGMASVAPTLAGALPSYPVAGNNQVEKVEYRVSADSLQRGRIYINAAQYFEDVLPGVWAYHTGGYQLCRKWLQDRKGRILSHDEIDHYRRMAAALAETLAVIREIDSLNPLALDRI